jgi:hypothetical protein
MSNILKSEAAIDAQIVNLISALDRRFVTTGKPFDLSEWTQYFAFDVVSKIAFGEAQGFVSAGKDKDGLIEAIQVTVKSGFKVVALAHTIYAIYKSLPEKIANWLFIPNMSTDAGIGKMMRVSTDKWRGISYAVTDTYRRQIV